MGKRVCPHNSRPRVQESSWSFLGITVGEFQIMIGEFQIAIGEFQIAIGEFQITIGGFQITVGEVHKHLFWR